LTGNNDESGNSLVGGKTDSVGMKALQN